MLCVYSLRYELEWKRTSRLLVVLEARILAHRDGTNMFWELIGPTPVDRPEALLDIGFSLGFSGF